MCCIGSMVVCRLWKNNEFHLNDIPGNLRNHPAIDCTTALFAAEQLDRLEQINRGECSSKEASSSFNCHSVEQTESGSEFDNLTKDLSQRHFSSLLKDCDEEDCVPDIMKDDIIKLDDSSYSTLPIRRRRVESSAKLSNQVSEDVMFHTQPFQGTANRRLRLLKEEPNYRIKQYSKFYEANKKNSHVVSISRWWINIIPAERMKHPLIPLFLVSVMLLVVFLCLFGVPQQVKWLRHLLVITQAEVNSRPA